MRFTRYFLRLVLCAPLCIPAAVAQFTSGSTGSDGAYNPTVSGDFDPVALNLDASGDNVFNFTTINIPAGVTIKLRASKLRNAAVTWLATGNVTIAGTLDLSGAPGPALNTNSAAQFAANLGLPEPGPGGYTGGLGARGSVGPQSGAGPGGGPPWGGQWIVAVLRRQCFIYNTGWRCRQPDNRPDLRVLSARSAVRWFRGWGRMGNDRNSGGWDRRRWWRRDSNRLNHSNQRHRNHQC